MINTNLHDHDVRTINIDRAKDKVVILAPSSAVKNDFGGVDISASLRRLEAIESIWIYNGFSCKRIEDQFDDTVKLGYFANSRAKRMENLRNVLLDPEVKIICAFRGGYGASELIFEAMNIKPIGDKLLIGFSDITLLHALFGGHYGLPSIHGAVLPEHEHMFPKLLQILQSVPTELKLSAVNDAARAAGVITGTTTGGNLTVFCTLMGTKLQPNTHRKILILEDVAESGYRLHRYLLHLYNVGLFSEANALILGTFSGEFKDMWQGVEYFVDEYLKDLPVFRTDMIGHIRDNHPFSLSAQASIENAILTVESPFRLI